MQKNKDQNPSSEPKSSREKSSRSSRKKSTQKRTNRGEKETYTSSPEHSGTQSKTTSSKKHDSKQEEKDSQKKQPQSKRSSKPIHRMVFSNDAGYSIAAIAVDQRMTDFWIEEDAIADQGISGNIYRGVISRIVPGLNAAFVDIGLDKHGFLSFQELGPEIFKRNPRGKRGRKTNIEEVLQQGDPVLVQISKETIADKGPALTAKVSLPGRFLVFMPYSDAIRMSRMLDDNEKKWFRELISREFDLTGGVIFRTASKGRSAREILSDLNNLTEAWKKLEKEFRSGNNPKLIHREYKLFERMLRDEFNQDINEIVIDHPRLKYRISQFLKTIAPRSRPNRLIQIHHNSEETVWKHCGLDKDIEKLFTNQIHLECGGRLILEEMETLTAIDVNTGKNVAGKSQEETILETNLEAAVEIPRQLRLRQIGGIIVIDFIDMRLKKNRERVFKTMERELAKDRTPSDIQEFTNLELIQITRQRLGRSLTQRLTYVCQHCGGSGRKPSISLT